MLGHHQPDRLTSRCACPEQDTFGQRPGVGMVALSGRYLVVILTTPFQNHPGYSGNGQADT
jgi:hypothetical protein